MIVSNLCAKQTILSHMQHEKQDKFDLRKTILGLKKTGQTLSKQA